MKYLEDGVTKVFKEIFVNKDVKNLAMSLINDIPVVCDVGPLIINAFK